MTPADLAHITEDLNRAIAHELRYTDFLEHFNSLPDDLKQRFVRLFISVASRLPETTGAEDAAVDGSGHSHDAGVDGAGRDAAREADRPDHLALVRSLGSASQEASRTGEVHNSHNGAADGRNPVEPEIPLDLIRSEKVLAQEQARVSRGERAA